MLNYKHSTHPDLGSDKLETNGSPDMHVMTQFCFGRKNQIQRKIPIPQN